ncbi:MAG: hypothetical protein WCV55_02370 [Candidatus Paceibacterota bacterium]
MKILFISEDLVAGNLAYVLTKEGNDVKLFIQDKNRRGNFENMVKKVNSWKKELTWVSKEGLIIFDGCGHGSVQDELREKGYSVVGSSEIGNKLENDRAYGDLIFKKNGLTTVKVINFNSLQKAINFVKKNRKKWVIKQNSVGTSLKGFNYVGMLDNADDVIDVLENYKSETKYGEGIITLQEKIDGIEIAVGRYFNGTDWVGPLEINLEHKKYFPGDLGPTTSEMGTVAWYDDNDDNKLFQQTLGKLKTYLQGINFRGDIDINCIVNEKGAFPLEATARFGSPIVHLQTAMHNSKWSDFLKAVADGKQYDLKWKKGYGVVIVVTVPTSHPFPFTKAERYISPKGLKIYFSEEIEKDMKNIHFEDVSLMKKNGKEYYYISDDRGYVLYVTSVKDSVEEARRDVYSILKDKIFIPKMFYRNDIGLKFIETDKDLLEKWGYMK